MSAGRPETFKPVPGSVLFAKKSKPIKGSTSLGEKADVRSIKTSEW